jgi:hypothetical protein
MYDFDVEAYSEGYGHSTNYLVYVPVYNQLYFEWESSGITEEQLKALHRDEVERAIDEEMDSAHSEHLDVDEIWDNIQKQSTKRQTKGRGDYWDRPHFEKDLGYQAAVYGELKTGEALEELQELLQDKLDEHEEEEEAEPLWVATPPEERVIHRFDDGFYVQRLTPDELGAEGKAMRMCVGRDDMGYKEAVRKGEIWILSMRTPAGRPKFTFEVGLRDGKPYTVKQIKGKANRVPGFDLGKEEGPTPHGRSVPKMKLEEVLKAFEVTRLLGIDPRDVYDLGPAIIHLRKHSKGPKIKQEFFPESPTDYGPTQYEQINEIMELLGTPPRRNPMRSLRGRQTFDRPYQRSL